MDKRLEAKDIKKSKAKDNPSEGRPSQDQGLEYSRPRNKNTGASVLKKKIGLQNFFLSILQKIFFQAICKKKVFLKFFQAIDKIMIIQKIVLSSSRGQGNFRGLEASRPKI